MPKNKATILIKGKDKLIRLYNKTLATALRVRLENATKEIKKA